MIHIDSMVLMALVDEKDDLYKEARHIVNGRENATYAVSLVAIGEVINRLSEKRDLPSAIDASEELVKLLGQGKVVVRAFGGDRSSLELSVKLMELDAMLKPADVLILTSMLCDESSSGLYSNDRVLTFSKVLRDYARSNGRWIKIPPGF